MKPKSKKPTKHAWTAEDRQRFSDRNILKAKRIQGKRKPCPEAKEWQG